MFRLFSYVYGERKDCTLSALRFQFLCNTKLFWTIIAYKKLKNNRFKNFKIYKDIDNYTVFHNSRRPHSKLQYKTPEQKEQEYACKDQKNWKSISGCGGSDLIGVFIIGPQTIFGTKASLIFVYFELFWLFDLFRF